MGTWLVVALLASAVVTGCASTSPESPKTSTCETGAINVRPGTPTDLPGGGQVGIGQVNGDASPVDTRLILVDGAAGEADNATLAVGGTFTVRGRTYSVTCVSEGLVTLDAATN
jgi:hypothetical protein